MIARIVLQAGEYEDGIPKNSTFEEGDWNGDGDFTTADLVWAFKFNRFELPAARGVSHYGASTNQGGSRLV